MFVAQEVMTEADTRLRETKDMFEKTKLYFMYDNPQVKPYLIQMQKIPKNIIVP